MLPQNPRTGVSIVSKKLNLYFREAFKSLCKADERSSFPKEICLIAAALGWFSYS